MSICIGAERIGTQEPQAQKPAKTRKELVAEAEAMGIEVPARATAAQIAKLIEEAGA